ncbi:MAG: SapC family protein [Gammaproteobacteria bacterium]|nr:SapC family protein [Gammaproteobacteria bacterium]MDH3749950.1 SapC family protein [Gammaproteobacteria bacterium]MDH3806840.1 SapC family protein [Gammaproteobacteria bacterium]
MANHVLLNNVDHKSLRVIKTRSAAYGDDVMCTMTFPNEFRSIQAHYPIVFSKEPESGKFQALALFGFEDKENLFLEEDGWDATYIPLTIERQPFLIGFQQKSAGGEVAQQTVIHIDMDSPRISETDGERVFLEHGGYTEYLNRINTVLGAIHNGFDGNEAFIDALLANELLESFTLDVELNDGTEYRLSGFFTVDEEKLRSLDGETLERLSRDGHLLPIYMVVASMSNFRDLIQRRNDLLEE